LNKINLLLSIIVITVITITGTQLYDLDAYAIHTTEPVIYKGEIKSAFNNKCLDMVFLDDYNVHRVIMNDCNDQVNQQWIIHDNGKIKTKLNHKCLDIPENTLYHRSIVTVFDCDGDVSQQWYLDNGQIKSKMNDKCLEPKDFPSYNTRVVLWKCTNYASQQWIL